MPRTSGRVIGREFTASLNNEVIYSAGIKSVEFIIFTNALEYTMHKIYLVNLHTPVKCVINSRCVMPGYYII